MCESSQKIIWILLAAAVVVFVTGAFILRIDEGDAPDRGTQSSGTTSDSQPDDQPDVGIAQEVEENEADTTPSDSEDLSRINLPAEGTFISGRVIDRITRKPVTSFEFSLRARKIGGVFEQIYRETVDESGGRFRFSLPGAYKFEMTIRSARYCSAEFNHLYGDDEKAFSDIEVELDPGSSVSGRVVDDASGEPVEGAFVAIASGASRSCDLWVNLLGYREAFPHTTSGADGVFTLRGFEEDSRLIAAIHPEYAQGFTEIESESPVEVAIRLKRGVRLFGRAISDRETPVQGLMIKIRGDKTALNQYCLTDADGRYRTLPVESGTLTVYAEPPPGRTDAEIGFSRERVEVTVDNEDVEVNFGPDPGLVTWSGILYGRASEPIPGGLIEVNWEGRSRRDRSVFARSRSARCDRRGFFEMCKLRPGCYTMRIEVPEMETRISAGEISLPEPGLIEKDIHITGGEITGLVIDGETGKPFTKRPGHVVARKSQGSLSALDRSDSYLFNTCRSDIDGSGRFRLIGLGNGLYRLHTVSWGAAAEYPHQVAINDHESVDGIEIVVPSQGMLDLRLSGFNAPDCRTFTLTFVNDQNIESYAGESTVDHNGSLRVTYVLKVGTHRVVLSFMGKGIIDREFMIISNERTEVRIDGSGLEIAKRAVTVEGLVSYTDGEPLVGAEVKLWPFNVAALGGRGSYSFSGQHSTKTDAMGRYTIKGVYRGNWWVRVGSDEADLEFPDLNIPADPDDPIEMNLTVPRGAVTGILCDYATSLPINRAETFGWLWVKRADSTQTVCEGITREDGSFRIFGIGSGRFRLVVTAKDHEKYESEIFFLAEGQVLDLGNILLKKKSHVEK